MSHRCFTRSAAKAGISGEHKEGVEVVSAFSSALTAKQMQVRARNKSDPSRISLSRAGLSRKSPKRARSAGNTGSSRNRLSGNGLSGNGLPITTLSWNIARAVNRLLLLSTGGAHIVSRSRKEGRPWPRQGGSRLQRHEAQEDAEGSLAAVPHLRQDRLYHHPCADGVCCPGAWPRTVFLAGLQAQWDADPDIDKKFKELCQVL